MAPIDDHVLRRVSRMLRLAPASLYLRSGDAVHLATALEIGELEVWNQRPAHAGGRRPTSD